MDDSFRIALIDIETSPNLGWVWGKWEQNVIEFEQEWHLLSFSVKWLNKKGVKTYALPDYPGYERDPENDKALAKDLWEVFNEADIIIAHNGDKFDIKKSNTRFFEHKLGPPSPYKSIDTLKLARKYFAFNSNKLDDLCQKLGIGKKVKHMGFVLWKKCMLGDPESWKLMKRYNAQDVRLLEAVYLRLRGWHATHPNVALKGEGNYACPSCGSARTIKRGYSYIVAMRNQRYQCIEPNCRKWSRGPAERIPGRMLR